MTKVEARIWSERHPDQHSCPKRDRLLAELEKVS